jgi:hypothetical protein
MSLRSNIIEYKACIKCSVGLTKSIKDYCKNCKQKASRNLALKSKNKMHLTKIAGRNTKNYYDITNKSIEGKFIYYTFIDYQQCLQFRSYTEY